MVEVKFGKITKGWRKLLFASLIFVSAASAQEVVPRVAGLGDNQEYMQLLAKERQLIRMQDSLSGEIDRVRELLRSGSEDRRTSGNEILRLEAEIFDVRNQTGITANRIAAIEEEFIVRNLAAQAGEGQSGNPAGTGKPPLRQYPDITRNDCIKERLSPQDHKALLEAQSFERQAAALVSRFIGTYKEIAVIDTVYRNAASQAEADSIYAVYRELERMNLETASSLGKLWSNLFDDKIYAYNYIIEVCGEKQLLARLESGIRNAGDEAERLKDAGCHDIMASYFAQKDLIFDCEHAIAELFRLDMAADSLRKAQAEFMTIDRHLPEIVYEQRLFLDYDEVKFASRAVYNQANPIPQVTIYPRGTIYRIMVGTYTARQSVSIFKGMHPLGYLRSNDGKYAYYAGGFPDFEGARNALNTVRERGFKSARIAVWHDGELTAIEDETGADGRAVAWFIEIGGADDLPDGVRSAIGNVAGNVDIMRSNDMFSAGPFGSAADAESAAEAIRKSDRNLTVRVVTK